MNLSKIAFFFTVLLTMFSCGNSYVLSPEDLEDVLVDLHLVEGVAVAYDRTFRTTEEKLDLYEAVYEKHGISKAQFDSTMSYYSHDLGHLTEVYDAVFKRIVALEKEVKSGRYALTTSTLPQEVNARLLKEDLEILPYVQGELWGKNRTLAVSGSARSAKVDVPLDTLINKKIELRYALQCDSLLSAQCLVRIHYADGKTTEEIFQLPTDNTPLVRHSWTVEELPRSLTFLFSTEPMNNNAKLSLSDFRLYDVAEEKHNIHIF